jgi:hypothetical protein
MSISTVSLERTFAIVVGIEKYDAGSKWNLNGPVNDARKFANWLFNKGVPPSNIFLFLSPLDDNSDIALPPGVQVEAANRQSISHMITHELPQKQGDLLYVFWGGHGTITLQGERRLFYADATQKNKLNFDLKSLLICLCSDYLSSFLRQIYIIDACANYIADPRLPIIAGETFSGGLSRKKCEQFVLLAARTGEVAKNIDTRRTGLFSEVVMEELAEEANSSWPPDMKNLANKLEDRFKRLRQQGLTQQTPTYFWYRDWNEHENSLGNIPNSTPLELAAEALLNVLSNKLTNQTWLQIQKALIQNTFKESLGNAIRRYATGERLALSRPLLDPNGLLSDPQVAEELAQIIRFEREPSAEVIGQRWQAAMIEPPSERNFTTEARLLLDYLKDELRSTNVFRPVFDAKSLSAIATNAVASTESLVNIEAKLATLTELIAARFSDLTNAFAKASFGIKDQIRDYTHYIEEKTHGFVGRKFVFDAIKQFTETSPRGYFFVRGDPGIGKSALSAQMVKTNGYVHHFNIRAEGVNKADIFLKNICAQLIAAYELKYSVLPNEATQDGGFLKQLLLEVSHKLNSSEKVIIIVDALDEVDNLGLSTGANTLYLPLTLPAGIYIVATTRKMSINLRIECEQRTLDIEQDSEGNIADIREYVEQAVGNPGIKAYIVKQGISVEAFTEYMVQKSQGNFMYLRYVLPEIERGAYKERDIEALPVGLQNYYEDHWRRMRGKDEDAWFRYKLPVVMALTVVKEPVSIDLIADFSKVQERPRIRTVLKEWEQFLHEELVQYEGSMGKRYRVYHASFHDFIAAKEEVEDERVDRQAAHKKIADKMWSDFFSDE